MKTSADTRTFFTIILSVLCLVGQVSPARAGRATDLVTPYARDSLFNFNLSVGYQRSLKSGVIHRELSGESTSETSFFKELKYKQIRHILSIHQDTTLWRAFQLSFEFPLIISDNRWLDFDQDIGPKNSSLVREGILPNAKSQMDANQTAVAGPDAVKGGYLLPQRSGLDQMYIGFTGAPLSQEREPTQPTWLIGFEVRLGLGSPMEYDPRNSQANTSVGRGLHQYRWWTSVSRRFRYMEPWMSVSYLLPQTQSNSLYDQTTFPRSGQDRSGPMQRGGGEIGLEIIPWEWPEKHMKVFIELAARLEGVFEGRDYSEMWEIFANNPLLQGPCRPTSDSLYPGLWNNGVYCARSTDNIPYPGITHIQSYAIFNGTMAVAADITRYLRARVGFGVGHEQEHIITYGNAGRSGNVTGQIEIKNETQIDPMYRPIIDQVGQRFRVASTMTYDFFVSLTGQF